MRRALTAAVVVLGLVIPAVIEAGWKKPKTMVVRGQVTDDTGQGVENVPIRVIATRRVVKFLTIESQPAEAELVTGSTDASGFYEIEVPKVRDYDFYFLRYFDGETFDAVRYAVPEDIEITDRISKRRPVVQDLTLLPAAGWDAVQRLISLYGAGSARSEIVRALGVPERTERTTTPEGIDRETWWYDTVGVAYVINDGRVTDKKTFAPRQESSSLARR